MTKTPLELAAEQISGHNIRLRAFLLRLTDPEDLGHAVTREVRELARDLATSQRASGAVAQTLVDIGQVESELRNARCLCGKPWTLGVVHQAERSCYRVIAQSVV